MQYGKRQSITLPSALTKLQRRVLVALHSLSHAAHDSADGLLALEEVLRGPPGDVCAGAGEARSTFLLKLHRHLSQADLTCSPAPEDTRATRLVVQRASDAEPECGTFDAGPGTAEAGNAEPGNGSSGRSSSSSSSGGGGGGCEGPDDGARGLGRRSTGSEQSSTGIDRRLQLLCAIAYASETDHPWVPAFATALSEHERGHAPFKSSAEQELLLRGLGVTLGPGAGPARDTWRLLLVTIWGGEGPWALLLLRAALLRTQIEFELVFDLVDGCLPVARAQVRAIAALLLGHLRCDGYAREQRLADLERSMDALRAGEGNVWMLPGLGAPQPRAPAAHGGCDSWGPMESPAPAPVHATGRRDSWRPMESPAAGPGGAGLLVCSPAPTPRPSGALEKGERPQWTWATLECAPPKGSARARRPSRLLRGSLERARPADVGLELGHVALGDGLLDLTRCWGTTADGARVSPPDANETHEPAARGVPLGGHASWLQWQDSAPGPAPPERPSANAATPSPTPAEPEPITSSLVKEVLVMDYGPDLEPADDPGACGACLWNRGLAALAAGRVARAGAAFASGRAPAPAALVRGVDPGGAAWAPFWCLYYAWALGHAAVPSQLQAMVRANRRHAARDLAASVRLLPLPGGAAIAATLSVIAERGPILPASVPPKPRPEAAPPVVSLCPDCTTHAELPGFEAAAFGGAASFGAAAAFGAAADGAPEKPLPAAAEVPSSPLPAIVNGLLGFPDALFVGPVYDAAQRQTGSLFRPFHSVEDALRRARSGQTVVLLPGTYAALRVHDVQATAGAPVRIQGLGSVVIAMPHKVRRGQRPPLIKVPPCPAPTPHTRTLGTNLSVCHIRRFSGFASGRPMTRRERSGPPEWWSQQH